MEKKSSTAFAVALAFVVASAFVGFSAETEKKTAASGSAENAATLPNPGDDWILRAATEEIGADNDVSPLERVWAVGKIVAIDSTGIETEDRRLDRRERTPRRPGDAVLFLPPVDPSAATAFCEAIRKASGARNRDRFWLRNGDEFDGELVKVDRRRVWIRAFDVEFAVPRGRVRAVRFATIGQECENSENSENGEK